MEIIWEFLLQFFFNLAEQQQQSGESFDQELFFRLFNLTFPFHALHKEKFNSYKQIENVRKCCLNCRNTAHENSDVFYFFCIHDSWHIFINKLTKLQKVDAIVSKIPIQSLH